jgi:hypothetical protein
VSSTSSNDSTVDDCVLQRLALPVHPQRFPATTTMVPMDAPALQQTHIHLDGLIVEHADYLQSVEIFIFLLVGRHRSDLPKQTERKRRSHSLRIIMLLHVHSLQYISSYCCGRYCYHVRFRRCGQWCCDDSNSYHYIQIHKNNNGDDNDRTTTTGSTTVANVSSSDDGGMTIPQSG